MNLNWARCRNNRGYAMEELVRKGDRALLCHWDHSGQPIWKPHGHRSARIKQLEVMEIRGMNVQIIEVRGLKEKYLCDGIIEYKKRHGPYAKVTVHEVADEKVPETLSAAQEEQAKEREGERILALIKPDTHMIALAIDGKHWS